MLYRLFTQNLNYEQVRGLVTAIVDGATLIKAEGIWQGESEHSLIIEIDDYYDGVTDTKIDQLCYAIKKLNQQDKIFMQIIESESKLV